MESIIATRVLAGLAYAQTEAHTTSVRAGNWKDDRTMQEAFVLIYRDVSRALEVITVGDGPSKKLKDVKRSEEVLADIIIRILDIAGQNNLHLAAALVQKLEHNELQSRLVKQDF